jgi:hypothetical protein
LGSEEGEKTFFVADLATMSTFSEDWMNSVIQSKRFRKDLWKKSQLMKMTTMDSLIAKYGIPHFVKIDVEGFELEVLKGLTHPINVISFEYTVPEQTNKVIACIEQLVKINENILLNYSMGETMQFALTEWITPDLMREHVMSSEFENTSVGDVYVCDRTFKNEF